MLRTRLTLPPAGTNPGFLRPLAQALEKVSTGAAVGGGGGGVSLQEWGWRPPALPTTQEDNTGLGSQGPGAASQHLRRSWAGTPRQD